MPFRTISKNTLLVLVTILVFAFLSGIILLQKQTDSTLPLRLKIPSINVDSAVEYVSLTKDGAMATPKNIANVGWYSSSTHPGEVGTSVMAGHYGWKNGKKSVFDSLKTLKIGDTIYVEDSSGKTVSFIVYKIKTFDPKAATEEIFSSNDGKAHLNLITCNGSWNKQEKSYSERLVIFTYRK